ncbi:hypothetical protein LT350_29375 [Mycolicibacterium smegmatis]|uniref:hypothetical protein n=1 Tax=Mycolicibacterium smegmatis TaxID=1772 RepID=UPI001E2D65EB|nr:hypothetical protein [Mycolicibacterium smegmatis]UGU30582.1 hypothetical protein LT350_29375 [Mycolicibacterium smegmatis]ULN71503.1 hypothetical protein KZ782_06165 [Mycolicibacterium smegmatis]
MFDSVFGDWSGEICGYRTLHLVDRPVRIDTAKAFPALGAGARRDELPMWAKAAGCSITGPWMPGRQIAVPGNGTDIINVVIDDS